MRTIVYMSFIAIAFMGGVWIGVDLAEHALKTHCESAVVSAMMEGKPFFYDKEGRPVMIEQTLRADGSVIYRGIKEGL